MQERTDNTFRMRDAMTPHLDAAFGMAEKLKDAEANKAIIAKFRTRKQTIFKTIEANMDRIKKAVAASEVAVARALMDGITIDAAFKAMAMDDLAAKEGKKQAKAVAAITGTVQAAVSAIEKGVTLADVMSPAARSPAVAGGSGVSAVAGGSGVTADKTSAGRLQRSRSPVSYKDDESGVSGSDIGVLERGKPCPMCKQCVP